VNGGIGPATNRFVAGEKVKIEDRRMYRDCSTRALDSVVAGSSSHLALSQVVGYYPSGGLGLVVVILLVLILAGRLLESGICHHHLEWYLGQISEEHQCRISKVLARRTRFFRSLRLWSTLQMRAGSSERRTAGM